MKTNHKDIENTNQKLQDSASQWLNFFFRCTHYKICKRSIIWMPCLLTLKSQEIF